MRVSCLTFDLGQMETRLRLFGAPGEVIREATAPGRLRHADLVVALLSLAAAAADAFGTDRFPTVCGGATGVFGHVGNLDEVGEALRRQFGTIRLVIADDVVTSYLGAMGNRPGVVAAVGTGLVALGVGPARDVARVDGAGAMMGDQGAGWWIGRRGLIAAMSATDGRPDASPALLDAAIAAFGPIELLPRLLADDPSPVTRVAAFAKEVGAVARAGDAVANAIWKKAGTHIGRTIVAAGSRAGLTESLAYTLVGHVALARDLLEPAISEELSAHFTRFSRLDAQGESIDGAVLLAQEDISVVRFSPMAAEFVQTH